MRRGCQQQEMAGDPGKHSAELIALGIFNFTAPHGGGHFVRFVADDQVPIRCAELVLQLLIARELVQAGNAEIYFVENISRYGGFQAVIGQNFKAQMEFLIELVLPLLGQIARRNDHAALQIAADDQLLQEQARHDGFARARIVGQNIAQRQPGQHFLIDRRNLMRQWLNGGGVDGQIRVEQMRQMNAIGLRNQAELIAVHVKAPWQALFQQG